MLANHLEILQFCAILLRYKKCRYLWGVSAYLCLMNLLVKYPFDNGFPVNTL